MRKRLLANFLILSAFVLGAVSGGFQIPFVGNVASVISDLFLRALKLVSLPIIFLAITSTISGMTDFAEMRRLGRKVLTYTLGTTIVAAAVALALFLLVDPVRGGGISAAGPAVDLPEGSYLSFFMEIVPSNLFAAFVENNVVGVAFIGILLSLAILTLPEEQKGYLHKLFSSLFAAVLKVTSFIIKLIPLAIFAFVTLLFQELRENKAHFQTLMLYLVCVVGANLVQGMIILPIFLKWKKISPLRSFRAMAPALSLAFFSKSSSATLPVTMRAMQENLGVSRRVSGFSLPLCSVINMNGCAAFILTTVLFVSMHNGIVFSPVELVSWIFLATIAAVGNAGVPMGCFFLSSAFLVGMDVPLYLMGLILPFYAVVDMVETALNVWSDACVTLVADKELGESLPAVEEAA